MTLSQELELKVDTVVSGTFTDYYEKLKKNLKPGTIWTSNGNVTTLLELRQALSTGLKIQAKQDSHISSNV